jgi:imidazolonepropionase-like amidohydrolase
MRVPCPKTNSSTTTLASRPAQGIKASLLIPGRGEPIKDGAVIIEDGKIAWVGSQASLPTKYRHYSFTEVPVVMPGMWDCHTHFMGVNENGAGGYEESAMASLALFGARTARDLQKVLMAGITTVREVGGYAGEVSPAVEEGTIVGPNVYSSVGVLSMTAGHGDIHNLPIDTVLDLGRRGGPFVVCDGVPECIRAVRSMIRRGAKLIKICTTGGVGSILDDPQDAQFSIEEIKAIVDEAARAKRIVAAHAHGKEGILNALHAGVKTIEHGSYLDEECIQLMEEKGAILVATRLVIAASLKDSKGWPPANYAKLLKIAEQHKKAYALAVKHGVKVALGTDWSPGLNAQELYYAVEAGLTPLEAIEACTATSPETLGPHLAPKSGQLKEGYDADIIAVSKDPLQGQNVAVLADNDNITHVWKGGKIFKKPSPGA